MSLSLRRDTAESGKVIDWWDQLQKDPGGRAGLKRCREVTDVFFQPSFHDLRRRIGADLDYKQTEGLAAVAAVLAHVKSNFGNPIAVRMAESDPGEKSRVSELRFRRLLQCQTRAELLPLLLRAIRILEGSVNLPSLIESVFHWSEPMRRRWAIDYYSEIPTTQTK